MTYAYGQSGTTRSNSLIYSGSNLMEKYTAMLHWDLGGGLEEDRKWRIHVLNLEHNNTLLTLTKSKFFQCNCSLNLYTKKKLDVNDIAGIKLSQNYQYY